MRTMIAIKKQRFYFASLFAFCISIEVQAYPYLIKSLQGKDNRGEYHLSYLQIMPEVGLKDLERFNNKLKQTLAYDYLCESDSERSKHMYVNTRLSKIYVDRNVLSFQVHFETYCGGPYPDAALRFYTFDLHTQKSLALNQFISQNKKITQTIYRKLLKTAHSQKIEDCQHFYTKEELAITSFQYRISEAALIVRMDLPHVARSCELQIKLNCNDLQPINNHNQKIHQPICQNK